MRPSRSPMSSPVFFTKKGDGSLRLCCDYRYLNSHTVKSHYPLPLTRNQIERVAQAKIYSKFDLRHAYYQLRVKEGQEWLTSIKTPIGQYEFLVMPEGPQEAVAHFQLMINDILSDFLGVFCAGHIDDFLVYSNTEEEHIIHVRKLLTRLLQHDLFVKLEKCIFHVYSIEFLGYILSPAGIKLNPKRVQAVTQWPTPSSAHDVQVFLGLANGFQPFIDHFSSKALPLTSLLKRGTPFKWDKAE